MSTRLLKIYASKYAEDPAVLIGNRDGLAALRDALDELLNSPTILTHTTATQDMVNGYFIQCREMSDDEVIAHWSKLPDQEEDISNLSEEEYALLNEFAHLNHA